MNHEAAMKLAQKSDWLMGLQERTGICFNKDKALCLYEHCVEEMLRIEHEIEPCLPLKPMNKSELTKATPPKNQFKNSKTGLIPSALCEKFFDRVEKSSDGYYGWVDGASFALPHHEPVTTMTTMKLKNQADIKNWLMTTHKWRPTIWNYKKDSHGKFIREKGKLVRTSPKFHDKGVLCTNLETLGATIELVKPVVRWLSLRNRRAVIYNPDKGTGWLCNKRLEKDGRLPAGASNITNTHRQKHRVVANIPRVSSYLGKEMRELFCASEGNVLVGYDAAGLEARVEAHWCYKYEGGEAYAHELLDGDTHSNNARLFFGEDIETKDGKVISKYRDPAKNGKYALTYGCQPSRLADTINVPQGKAKELYEGFWDTNTALKGCRDAVTRHWKQRDSKSIVCSLTGYILLSRSEHSLVNLLFQHTGAIIMDYSLCLMDSWLGGIKYDSNNLPMYLYKGYEVRRVIYYHDEAAWECLPEIADDVLELGIMSIIKAGEALKLNVPLDADGNVGQSWADIH